MKKQISSAIVLGICIVIIWAGFRLHREYIGGIVREVLAEEQSNGQE